MKEVNEKLEKLRIESCTKCIRNDLSKGNMIFSEESSRPYLRDGQHGGGRIETNLGDYSVSLLPEARTRGIKHVSMRRLASTQSQNDGSNQSSFRSVETSLQPHHNNPVKMEKERTQPKADGSS